MYVHIYIYIYTYIYIYIYTSLSLSIHIYIYIERERYVCVYVYTYVFVYIYIYMYTYISTSYFEQRDFASTIADFHLGAEDRHRPGKSGAAHIYIYIYIYVYIHIYIYICMYLHIYIYIYIHILLCVYIYIYIYLFKGGRNHEITTNFRLHLRFSKSFELPEGNLSARSPCCGSPSPPLLQASEIDLVFLVRIPTHRKLARLGERNR